MGVLAPEEVCDWRSAMSVAASRPLIGEENREEMNMDEGRMKGLIQRGRLEGPPPLKWARSLNNKHSL